MKTRHLRRRPLIAGFAIIAALAVAAPGCGSDDETLTIYSGRDQELIQPVLDRFAEQTGTEVEVRYGDSAELAATILEEGDNSPADVFVSQDAGALGALGKDGRLAELPQGLIAQVPARYSAEDGTWVGLSGRVRVIAFGEDVDATDVPDSVLDLVGPEWSGRVGWAPTNASFQAFVTAMRVSEGEEETRLWLEQMVENDVQSYEKNSVIRDAIASGEIDLGLINHYYVAQAKDELGEDYPVDVHFPSGDVGSLINVAGAAELSSTDNADGALELIEFLLAAEQQEYFATETKEYPLVAGVELDADLPPLEEIPAPEVDLAGLADLEATLELLRETGAL